MQNNKTDKRTFDLDLIGLSLDIASKRIHEFDPELRLSIHETKSYKDHELHNVYDGIVIRQENQNKAIALTIGYF